MDSNLAKQLGARGAIMLTSQVLARAIPMPPLVCRR
jgi:hypothetical protein